MFRRAARSAIQAARGAAAAAAPAGAVGARHYAASAYAAVTQSQAIKLGAAVLGVATCSLGFAADAKAAANPAAERTYIMVKPDGVHRGLISEIMARFERKGYRLVAVKILVPTEELAGAHYAEHNGKPFYPKLVSFLSSGPVVAMVWEGKEVIKYGRTMIGATNPLASAPGTIRGDYGVDVGRNIIHGSDSVNSAQKEIALWFKPEELAEYTPATKSWVYE